MVSGDTCRLVDEFEAAVRRGRPLPGLIETCLMFGDLEWPPQGPDVIARTERDPALIVTGYSRYVALSRICGEVRYFAAPVPEGTQPWSRSGEDPARIIAVAREPEVHERGVLSSVADAVVFTAEYLEGAHLVDIALARARR